MYIRYEFWPGYCKRIFGDSIPDQPLQDHTNTNFGGLKMVASKIYFSNGIDDPWQHATMLEVPKHRQGELVSRMIDCPDCAHCIDLRSPDDNDP